MSNPMFNERVFRRVGGGTATLERPAAAPQHTGYGPGSGYVPPAPSSGSAGWGAPPTTPAPPVHPMAAPPAGRTMTFGGTVAAAALMLAVLAAGAWLGWQQVTATGDPDLGTLEVELTSLAWIVAPLIVGFVLAITTALVPRIAQFTALPYALAEGVLLGVISHLYDVESQGIAIQALLATGGVFLVMLGLYSLRILRATPKFVKGVIAATAGVAVMYLVGLIASAFGAGDLRFWSAPTPLGIGISLVIVAIAAFNLIVDFDFIERGVRNGAPAHAEWYGAFALMVTIVWLYLELLRLLSKLRR